MGASAHYLIPARARPQQTGAVGFAVESAALAGVAVASVAVPVYIASYLGASTLVMVLVGIAAFWLLMPLATISVGLALEA